MNDDDDDDDASIKTNQFILWAMFHVHFFVCRLFYD